MPTSPYGPYRSIEELLRAAGVAPADVAQYSTEDLLGLAASRTVEPPRVRSVVRSIYLPEDVLAAAEKKARRMGVSFNEIGRRLFARWVQES